MSSSRLLPIGRYCFAQLPRSRFSPKPPRATLSSASNIFHKPHFAQGLIVGNFRTTMSFSNTSTGDKPADPYTAANKDNAPLEEKVTDLVAFIDACKFGMMTTRDASSGKLVSRCMAVAAKENGGIDLLFHTNTESHKTDEVASDSNVNISFLNSTGEWASLAGTAKIDTDRALVKEHYNPILKSWLGDLGDGKHDGGPEDPRIAIIRVKTTSATYAVVSKNIISRAVEVAQGAVTGKPAEINKLREISESEVGKWRSSH